jgi:SAM-dependent methyltransferase
VSAGPLTKNRVPGEFDRVAGAYDLLTGLNPGYNRHLHLSARRLELPRASDVLDLCCGTGASTLALLTQHPDARITAADASDGMLEIARRRLPSDRIRLLTADAMDPSASGIAGPFDGIFMCRIPMSVCTGSMRSCGRAAESASTNTRWRTRREPE